MEEIEKNTKKKRKHAAGSLVAGITAISVLIGGLFSSPSDIVSGPKYEGPKTQQVVVQMQAEPLNEEDEHEEDEEKKKSLKSMIRAWILGLPVLVRVFFVLPLWVIGYGIIAALTALWSPFLAPVLSTVFRWMMIAGVLLLSMIFIKKAVSPETSVKKIFSKGNLIFLFTGSFILLACDCILPFFVDQYAQWQKLFLFIGGLLFLLIIAIAFLRRKKQMKIA